MRTVYYVAEEDPTKAQAIIAEIMAPNEKVEAYGLLSEATAQQEPPILMRPLRRLPPSPSPVFTEFSAFGEVAEWLKAAVC